MGYTRKDFRDDLDAIYVDTGNTTWTAAQKNSAINQAIDALWPECKASKKDESKVLVADTYLYTPTGQPTELGYSQAFLEQDSDEEYLLLRRVMQTRELVSGILKWVVDIPKDVVDNNDVGKTILLRYHGPFDHFTGDQIVGSGIAFAATTPGTITDTGNGLAFVQTGDTIIVSGSADNEGTYVVSTGNVAGTIRTTEATTLEAAGDTITIGVGTVTEQDLPYLPVLYYAQMALCTMMLQRAGSSDIGMWREQIAEYRALWLQMKKDNLVLSMACHIGLRRR